MPNLDQSTPFFQPLKPYLTRKSRFAAALKQIPPDIGWDLNK